MGEEQDKDKMQDLSERLKRAEAEYSAPHKERSSSRDDMRQGVGFALRAGIEMVVALLVGFGIGYYLDGLFDTRPILMIIIGFLGLGAGVSNIYRLVNRLDSAVGYGNSKSDDKNQKKHN